MSLVLLGILNSQAAGAVAGDYELLETQVLTSSATSVTFTGLDTLAAGYQHLQIRAVARSNKASGLEITKLRFNGDSGSNYARHGLGGSGSSVSSYGIATQTWTDIGRIAGDTAGTDVFGSFVTDILDFSSASKNTTVRSLTGVVGTTTQVYLNSGGWFNTAAVTSLEILPEDGTALLTGSRFSLYGIKGA